MKAVVFTTDAIFSLIIAAVGITILFYFVYTSPAATLVSYSKVQNIFYTLLSTHVSQIKHPYGNSVNRVGSVPCGRIPAGAVYCQELSIDNAQSSAMSANTQVMITYNALDYAAYLATNLQNMMAYNSVSGAVVPMWLEGNTSNEQQTGSLSTSNSIAFWIKLPDAVSAGTTDNNIFLAYFPTTMDELSSAGGYGAAPQLWCASGCPATTYGGVDNGARVFNFYDDFSGTTLSGLWGSSISGGPTYSINEGITFSSGGSAPGIIIPTKYSYSPSILELYDSTAPVDATDPIVGYETSAPSSTCTGTGYYSCNSYSGRNNPGGSDFGACQTVSDTQTCYALTSTSYGAGIYGLEWPSTGTQIYTFDYSQIGAAQTSTALAYASSQVSIAAFLASGSSIKYQWVRTRTYPPSGVQPTVTPGNVQTACGSASSQTSVLSYAAGLYESGDGSCADALLNNVYSLANYSLIINGSAQPYQRIAYFNGKNSYMTVGTSRAPSGSDARSLFGWIYFTGNGSKNQWIYSSGTGSGGDTGFSFGLTGDGAGSNSAQPYIASGGGSSYDFGANTLFVKRDRWYFIGVTYATGATHATFYLNGASDKVNASAALNTTPSVAAVGRRAADGCDCEYFPGYIANLQFYNTSLNATQEAALYSGGMQGGPLLVNSLVSWWPLDGSTGDYGGSNNTGIPTNVSYKYSGYSPASLRNSFSVSKSSAILPVSSYETQFNGVSSVISMSTSAGMPTGASARTECAWVYYTNTAATYRPIFDYGTYAVGERNGFYLDNTTGAKHIDAVGETDDVLSTGTVPAGSWQFVCFTYNGATTITFYIDGKLDSTKTLNSAWNTVIGNPPSIGKGSGEPTYFNGSISNVQIYNTSLSSTQVAKLYREGIDGLPVGNTGLVGWWPLNGNANDYSGNGNNGVPHNVNYSSFSEPYNIGIISWK